jgi:hypothetical protein
VSHHQHFTSRIANYARNARRAGAECKPVEVKSTGGELKGESFDTNQSGHGVVSQELFVEN